MERLGGVTIPVLIVSSSADPVHTTERGILASFPQARLEVIDAGPEIPGEQPVAFARIVDGFVREVT